VTLSGTLTKDLVYYNRTVWSPEGREYVFTDVMAENGWFVVYPPENATFIWTTGFSDMPDDVRDKLRLGDGQIWNQIEDSWYICDKERLHNLLARVGKTYLQPQTYGLSDPGECIQFFKMASERPDMIWVTKDPGSSQGDGIQVNPDIKKMREEWLSDPESPVDRLRCKRVRNSKRKNTLVQQYIIDPLTLEGKKMEIRTYWFITLDPLYVFYYDGTVRLTTRDYKPGEWSDPLIHITNTKQQKLADPNYEQTATERKWQLQDLGKYLVKQGKTDNADTFLKTLKDTLKEYIGTVAQASLPHFRSLKTRDGWDGRFELMGMDVILGSDLRVWMTEIQDGPSMSRDPGTIKEKLIPELLTEMADIILEIDQFSRFGIPPANPLRSPRKWEQLDMDKYKLN